VSGFLIFGFLIFFALIFGNKKATVFGGCSLLDFLASRLRAMSCDGGDKWDGSRFPIVNFWQCWHF
jgi:hypothetical protein